MTYRLERRDLGLLSRIVECILHIVDRDAGLGTTDL